LENSEIEESLKRLLKWGILEQTLAKMVYPDCFTRVDLRVLETIQRLELGL